MKNRLKNTAKGAAIVGLALASVVSAQAQQVLVNSYAQGDLIAGFTTGSGNDLLVNLGPESWLVDGHYWDIASLLSSAGISATDPNLQFGIVGDSTGPQTVFSTHTGAILPNKINSISVFNTANTAIGGLGNALLGNVSSAIVPETATGQSSWYGSTVGGGTGTIFANLGSINGAPGEGQADQSSALDFYATTVGTGSSTRTFLDTFTLQDNGALVYGTIPEPATNAMFAVAGLLAFAFRNKFSRKQA